MKNGNVSPQSSILSQTITFLRLPLIVAVVYIHTHPGHVVLDGIPVADKDTFPAFSFFQYVITEELARIAVPLFFFISGFLFFYRSGFSTRIYGQKLRKRVRTLLVPYVLWNAAFFLVMFCAQAFLHVSPDKRIAIEEYGWLDWLNIFWADKGGMPASYQFWFVRDLMVAVLLSPVLYLIVKHLKAFGVFAFGVLWLFGIWFHVTGFNIDAFFFFAFGAWYSMNKCDFTAVFGRVRLGATCAYLILLVVNTWLWHINVTDYSFLLRLGIFTGLVAVVSWTAHGISNNRLRVSAFLASSSFFVYAYHVLPVAMLVKAYVRLLPHASDWAFVAGYLLIPLFISAVGVGIYALLHRYLPAFTAVITGGR